MFVVLDKVGRSNDKSLSFTTRPKGEAHSLASRTLLKVCEPPLVWRGRPFAARLRSQVLTLLWEIMATICHKGHNYQHVRCEVWGLRSPPTPAVTGIWSQARIRCMLEEIQSWPFHRLDWQTVGPGREEGPPLVLKQEAEYSNLSAYVSHRTHFDPLTVNAMWSQISPQRYRKQKHDSIYTYIQSPRLNKSQHAAA